MPANPRLPSEEFAALMAGFFFGDEVMASRHDFDEEDNGTIIFIDAKSKTKVTFQD